MSSLLELQRRFANTLGGSGATLPPGLAVYRNTIASNYRNALRATYPVLRQLAGASFFRAAVDAFVATHPPTSGDLNVYGDAFGEFLAGYGPASSFAYLPDVAALEWALDEAARTAEVRSNPADVVATLARITAERVAQCRFALHPSCRFVASRFPVLGLWQAHRGGDGDGVQETVSLEGASADRLLVRREDTQVSIERLSEGEFVWLCALHEGASLESATDLAAEAQHDFDLGAVLAARVADGTLVAAGTAN